MERKRKYKMFSIFALIVAIAGMTLGFAAFSKVLTINASAIVVPNQEDFKILLSGSNDDPEVDFIVPEVTGDATASNGVIVNDLSVSTMNASINFTEPGQSVTYTLYIHNVGEYDPYLKKIEFLPVEGETLNVVCVPDEGTNEILVQQACESINVIAGAVINGNEIKFYETVEFDQGLALLKTDPGIGRFMVIYEQDGVRVDGPFTVKLGGIGLHYSSTN